ncbi:MAG TPA: hypothetical protein VD766_05615 [Solirubrobacterales bacterium]|nr:hypothetical protein [Solirubrobacterales bacterium]
MRNMHAAAAIAAALLATPATPALAHEGNPDFRSEVEAIDPDIPGLEVEVTNFDDSLRMVNNSGKDVLVKGYEGEPYARVLADGSVELNRNSPAYYLNDDRFGEAKVPEGVDGTGSPDWELVDESSMLQWHDHRAHWMSTALPPQVEDESEETKIFDYSVPIEVDGENGSIEGTLTWVGREDSGFPVLPVVVGALAIAAIVVTALVRRRRWAVEDATGKREDDSGW